MANRTIFDVPVVPGLQQLLQDVKDGVLRIPYFQRPFVWDDGHRLQLLDSVIKGFSIGSLLVWRTQEAIQVYDHLAGYPIIRDSEPQPSQISYVLDGHQRLVTLFTALMIDPSELPAHEERPRLPIYVELAKGQATLPLDVADRPIRFWKEKGVPPSHWLPLWKLLNEAALEDFIDSQKAAGAREVGRQALSLAKAVSDYPIPVIPYLVASRTLVAESITRLNTQSQKMSELHVAHALLFKDSRPSSSANKSPEFNLVQQMESLCQALSLEDWGNIEDRLLLNVLKLQWKLPLHGTDPRKLEEKFRENPGVFDTLAQDARRAISWMKRIGVLEIDQLPSGYHLIGFIQVAHRLRERGRDEYEPNLKGLWRWFWRTGLQEAFTGKREYQLTRLLNELWENVSPEPSSIALPTQEEESPVLRPILSFQQTWVRSRCLCLLLQERARGFCSSLEVTDAPPSYVEPLLPRRLRPSHPASLVMVRDAQELAGLRKTLEFPRNMFDLQPQGTAQEILNLHCICEDALLAAHGQDWNRFLALRLRALHALESQRAQDVGLTLEPLEADDREW